MKREIKEKEFLTLCGFDLTYGYFEEDYLWYRRLYPEQHKEVFGFN